MKAKLTILKVIESKAKVVAGGLFSKNKFAVLKFTKDKVKVADGSPIPKT